VVYFCTGNHDWTDSAFGLVVKPIVIEDGAWVGARATVLPGVTIKSHSIVAACTVIAKDTEPYMIYSGNPAIPVKERKIRI
jgi:putative colanic acid biosynthesis acetyltransferase WcaF